MGIIKNWIYMLYYIMCKLGTSLKAIQGWVCFFYCKVRPLQTIQLFLRNSCLFKTQRVDYSMLCHLLFVVFPISEGN